MTLKIDGEGTREGSIEWGGNVVGKWEMFADGTLTAYIYDDSSPITASDKFDLRAKVFARLDGRKLDLTKIQERIAAMRAANKDNAPPAPDPKNDAPTVPDPFKH